MAGIFLSFPQSVLAGATVVNAFAIFCTLALLSVALRVIWIAIRFSRTQNSEKPQEYVFFNSQLGNYAACLLVAMTFNTVAGIMALPWLVSRGITLGAACTAQAFLTQIGTWSSAFFTVLIAVHTFNSLVLKRKQSLILSRCIMCAGWALSVIMAALPFFLPRPLGEVYGADGIMCGIRDAYIQLRFLLHLLPILVASVLSAILYSVIYLVLRGTLNIKGGIRLTLDPNERWGNTDDDNYHRFIARVARSMIWYPVAYVALLVPYSVLRLLQISGFIVPFGALVFACVCWFMLGVVNVALLYNTLRVLGPAFDAQASTRKDIESAYAPSTSMDKQYSTTFSRGQKLMQEKVLRYHMPMPSYSSSDSLGSESGLLSLNRQNSTHITFGSDTSSGYGRKGVVASPPRSRGKAEALAQSPPSSTSESNSQLRHVRTPSFALSPLSEEDEPLISGSLDSVNSRTPLSRPLERSTSSSSAEGPARPRNPSPKMSPKKLTLLTSRSPSSQISRPTPASGQEPLFLSTDPADSKNEKSFVSPRSPPTPPIAVSRIR